MKAVPGVTDATVDLPSNTAAVTAEGTVTNDSLTHAVEDAGYSVKSVS